MSATIPDELSAIAGERIVDLDVRAELRAGGEPFSRIMAAVAALPADGVLRVRAIFEPAPLYRVLGKQGFAHATEELGLEDWRVWFYRSAAVAPPARASQEIVDDPELVVIDVRDLDPPEPMVRTLDALTRLPRGKTLVQINSRVPQFLLPKLRQRGFDYEIREQADLVRVFIRHAEEKVTS